VDLVFADDPAIEARATGRTAEGNYVLEVPSASTAMEILNRLGRMPLPPYIRREKDHDPRDEMDRDRYQTIFAANPTAVAAPTAALHFTEELFAQLDRRQIERAFVTLDVGPGTFKPLTSDTLNEHVMHRESYTITPEAAAAINRAKSAGRRIVAVGTTSARVLESQPADQPIAPHAGSTEIFIYPPYQWKWVDALVTNFHLPRSTLIALVAAKVGLDEQRRIYAQAIAMRYRFFSYGDAMLVE
jgi:S-adenosylmethionine:tRNA ribosyltransferase-isomerase